MPQYRTIPTRDNCHSEVAGVGQRTLCVTVPELVECGVSESYIIKKALRGQRLGEYYNWPHHKEGNTVYVHYDGLKDRYKSMINGTLCEGVDANLWTTNRDSAKRARELAAICRTLPEMVEVDDAELKGLIESGLFEGEQAHRVARAAAWLRLWRRLDVKTARSMGFDSVTELQAALFEHCAAEQKAGAVRFPKPINSERTLDRKAREFAGIGMRTLIGGYFGNVNREIMNPQTHAVLVDLAGSPLKYSFEDISMMYNSLPEYADLPRMTTSAIKTHLNKPSVRRVWYYLRHGKAEGDNTYQPFAERETPALPDHLWSVDGTSAQLYYRDAQGRVKSDLYIYFVTDACTGAIIGSSIAYTETTGLVLEAFQDAVERHGNRPHQMQYDNSSANVQQMVKGVMKNMSRASFPCKPYLGRAKYVEEIIGHFQQRTLRYNKNFKGGNVTARSANSKANPDLLKYLRANPQELPTEAEAIEQLKAAIEAWNNRGERRDNYGQWVGQSKIDKYNEPYEGRRKFNYFEKISMFMVELEKPYKYKQKGIEVTIGKRKYNYIVPDPDNSANDFIFSNMNMYAEFKVKINAKDMDHAELLDEKGKHVAFAISKEKFAASIAGSKPGDRAKVLDFIRKQEANGFDYSMAELRRQRNVLETNGLRATGTEDFYGAYIDKNGNECFGWREASKQLFNRSEGYLEDMANGMAERETPTSRKLSKLEVLQKMR